MQPIYRRGELDEIAGHYSLDSAGVDALLDVAGARPAPGASLQFLARMMRIGGVLSLAAGVVFYVAANWSRIPVFGRFALLELLLLVCAVVALLKPPPANVGRAALFLAFVVTGALLALFGQTYQTGADVYELFLTWTLLGLPLAALARWSVASAAWLVVFNTALLLYFGWTPAGGVFWALFGSWQIDPVNFLVVALWLNVGLWLAGEILDLPAAPQWVRRLAIFCAFVFGTWAGVVCVVDSRVSSLVLLALFVAMVVVLWYAWRVRTDIFPVAMVIATFIIVSMVWLADVADFDDEAIMLFLALWLIVTSTIGARILAGTARRWRAEGVA